VSHRPWLVLASVLALVTACNRSRAPHARDEATPSRQTPGELPRDASSSSLWPATIEPLGGSAHANESAEACLARHRASLSTGVAEAIAELEYDRFFEDVCVTERALSARDATLCRTITASAMRDGCTMRVAVLAGDPEMCPVATKGRDPLCLAFTTGELAFCETAMSRDRPRCRATLRDDPRACRGAIDLGLCEATHARFAAVTAPRRKTRSISTSAAVTATRKDAPGEVTPVLPDFARGLVLAREGCSDVVEVVSTTERFGTRPALVSLRFTLPPGEERPIRIAAASMTLRMRLSGRTFDTVLGASGELVIRELARERLGRIELDLDVTVRDGDERWRIHGAIATFVRDLETGACTPD
jgi:hypothetical protein